MSESSVNTVILAEASVALAEEAAVMPAAPDPMMMISLAIWLTFVRSNSANGY